MFKILTIGVLIYLLYRFTFQSGQIGPSGVKKDLPEEQEEDGDYIDYEEVD